MLELSRTTLGARAEEPPAHADDAPPVFSWPKVCACGAGYERTDWLRLRSVGVMRIFHDVCLDLRNCTCGSTLAAPEDDVFKPSLFERHCDAVRIAQIQKERARAAVRRSVDARSRFRKCLDEMRRARHFAL